MRPIIDAHLDLAWNALSFDRDQLLSIEALRSAESHMRGKGRGRCTVSLPEMRRAGVGICLATVLARALPGRPIETVASGSPIAQRSRNETILRENLDFANQTIASAAGIGQLAYYQLLEGQDHLRMIRNARDLDELWESWSKGPHNTAPIGIVLSMEGADPIVDPDQLQWWWEQGLRTACLAHYGPSAYAMGTGGDGPLTGRGVALLEVFERLGMILDLVHTADTAFAQALDRFGGGVFVSHGNCRALVAHDRQLSDEQISQIVQRDGVIGTVLDCWMTVPGYKIEVEESESVRLEKLVDHIDHICQLAGNARHVGIGSDLDGGFGAEQTPDEIDTIGDLHRLEPFLASRGYSDTDINRIFHGNWLDFLRRTLPK